MTKLESICCIWLLSHYFLFLFWIYTDLWIFWSFSFSSSSSFSLWWRCMMCNRYVLASREKKMIRKFPPLFSVCQSLVRIECSLLSEPHYYIFSLHLSCHFWKKQSIFLFFLNLQFCELFIAPLQICTKLHY